DLRQLSVDALNLSKKYGDTPTGKALKESFDKFHDTRYRTLYTGLDHIEAAEKRSGGTTAGGTGNDESGGGEGECCIFNEYGGGGCGPCNRGGGPVLIPIHLKTLHEEHHMEHLQTKQAVRKKGIVGDYQNKGMNLGTARKFSENDVRNQLEGTNKTMWQRMLEDSEKNDLKP